MKLTLFMAAVGSAAIAHAEFSAGFARVDITPPIGIQMVGYYHKNYDRRADGIMDPLHAECVAVSDGVSTALIYRVDHLHLQNPFLAKAIPDIISATGVPQDRIYIHSTHTHTGPAVCPNKDGYTDADNRLVAVYADFLVTRLVDVGRMALADLAPSKIGVAKTECRGISFIRRYRMKDGSVKTNPRPNQEIECPLGTPDETLQVVRFKRTGAPDIAIVNFGTHPDTTSGRKISADWPGVVCDVFENGIGGGVKCMFLNAAQGDVNHLCRNPTPGRACLNEYRKKGTPTANAIAKYMGRAVAGAAMSVWDVCEEIPAGRVQGLSRKFSMPANLPTADELKWVEMFDAGRKDEIPLGWMEIMTITAPRSRVRTLKNGPDHFDICVSTIAIGDSLAFAGLPCEPFVDIGRDIKAQSPFKTTVVTCLTNGSEGYIPSTKAHHEGGYEGLSTRYAEPTGDKLVAAQVGQLKELFDAERNRREQ